MISLPNPSPETLNNIVVSQYRKMTAAIKSKGFLLVITICLSASIIVAECWFLRAVASLQSNAAKHTTEPKWRAWATVQDTVSRPRAFCSYSPAKPLASFLGSIYSSIGVAWKGTNGTRLPRRATDPCLSVRWFYSLLLFGG